MRRWGLCPEVPKLWPWAPRLIPSWSRDPGSHGDRVCTTPGCSPPSPPSRQKGQHLRGGPSPAEADAAEARTGARWSPTGSRGHVPRHQLQWQMQPSPRCPRGCKSKTQGPTALAPPGAKREGLVQSLLGGRWLPAVCLPSAPSPHIHLFAHVSPLCWDPVRLESGHPDDMTSAASLFPWGSQPEALGVRTRAYRFGEAQFTREQTPAPSTVPDGQGTLFAG